MLTTFRVAIVGALGVAALAGSYQPAAAIDEGRAFWLRSLQEQRSARLAETQVRADAARAGVTRSAARRPARTVPAQRVVRQASLRPRRQMDPRFLPKTVPYTGKHRAGTIVIDTSEKFLYHVQAGGKARRYGVGVGRPGFQWTGRHNISMKREWPGWTPPAQMRKRQPDLPAYMPGGPNNPLGARALYLGSTLYRIHGSNEPWSIGHAVSSGCIRMRNEDVIELYQQVRVGTPVVVVR